MKSLQDYFREFYNNGIVDHTIRASVDFDNNVSFYIHPATVSGDILDFVIYYDKTIPAQVPQKNGTILVKKAKDIIEEQDKFEFERFKCRKTLINGGMVDGD